MKKNRIRYYAGVCLLTANIALTSCSLSSTNEEPAINGALKNLAEKTAELYAEIEEENQRKAEELRQAAEYERIESEIYNNAIGNSEVLETEEFKDITYASIVWDNDLSGYKVICRSDTNSYTVTLSSEKLVGYILKNTKCEFIVLEGITSAEVIKEFVSYPNLKNIAIYNSNIEDISALGELINLEGIRINNCPNVTNINFFEQLPNITAVEIEGTNISDITPLRSCANIILASLRCNAITNPEVLSDLENLQTLKLEYNQISDITNLNCFISKGIISEENAKSIVDTTTNHRLIFSSNNCEEDGCVLSIKYFDAQGEYYAKIIDKDNQTLAFMLVEDQLSLYEISEKLNNRTRLELVNFPEDFNILNIFREEEYESLIISDCKFDSLYFLSDFSGLKSLSISNCHNLTEQPLSSVFGLWGLHDLKVVSIADSEIGDLSSLANARNIESLSLNRTKTADYEFLNDMKNLKELDLIGDDYSNSIDTMHSLLEKGVKISINNILFEKTDSLTSYEEENESGEFLDTPVSFEEEGPKRGR